MTRSKVARSPVHRHKLEKAALAVNAVNGLNSNMQQSHEWKRVRAMGSNQNPARTPDPNSVLAKKRKRSKSVLTGGLPLEKLRDALQAAGPEKVWPWGYRRS